LVEVMKGYGWKDKEFKAILDEVLSSEENVLVTDISSPPGTSKTKNTLKYAVEHRKPLIASFPTHTNQEQALEYIIKHLEDEKPKRLPFFVLDYAGLENYCIFYQPEVLMKFLDKFKESKRESYTKATENFLGNPIITAILVQRGLNIDEIWYEIGEALDEYVKSKDKKKYILRIREIVNKKGQYEICRGVCPLGIAFWQYRSRVYHDLSEAKIITWRKERVETWKKKYPKAGKHIIVANPENCVDKFEDLLNGKYNLESVLCPRLLLISKTSLTKKGNKPNYIAVRRSMILTPHAGLQFVLSVVKREHEIQGLHSKHLLFIDEYDTILKPKTWKLYSISDLSTLIAVADSIIKAGIGKRINGIYIDEYLYRYAKYIRAVSNKVKDIVEKAINESTYHPIVNLFVEGAFSRFEEKILSVNLGTNKQEKLVYEALSPRPIHIKHFVGDDLIPIVLNEKIYFGDLASQDPEWRINLRIAKINFSKLTSNLKIQEFYPQFIKTYANQKEITLRKKSVEKNVHKLISDLREYLRPLLDYPRYAIFFKFDESGKLQLASLDISIYTILQLRGILTSASPVIWDLLVSGPRPGFSPSLYVSLVNDNVISTVQVKAESKEEFYDKLVTKYNVAFNVYKKGRRDIEEAVISGSPIPKTIELEQKQGIIKQISVLSSMSMEYSKLLQVYYIPTFQPLFNPPPNVNRSEISYVREMIKRSLSPYINYIQYAINYAKGGKHILLLVQNKFYAGLLAKLANAKLCHKNICGEKVKKPTHFSNGLIDITWFRSRAERGIDLPNKYSVVIVIGSPYPRPSYVAGDVIEPSEYTTAVAQSLKYTVVTYNTKTKRKITIAHIPYDILSGISELTQAVGRATRSVMRSNEPVKVLMPSFLKHKIMIYAPLWMKMEGSG